jgi:hypothetical protein
MGCKGVLEGRPVCLHDSRDIRLVVSFFLLAFSRDEVIARGLDVCVPAGQDEKKLCVFVYVF